MRIAQLSTPFISVPPKDYGGTELVAYNLAEGLTKAGHAVTLYAPGDSKTSATLKSPFPEAMHYDKMKYLFSPLALKLFWMNSLPTLYHTLMPFEEAREFDIIHNHIHYLGLFFSRLVETPTVHTYHGDLSSAVKSPIEKMVLEKYRDANWIAISESQKKGYPKLNFVATIHHGVAIEKYPYNEDPDDYLIWLGRITSKKGIVEAISVAKALNKPLIICGVINARDEDFFNNQIKPLIDGKNIIFKGGVGIEEKAQLLGSAKALLYPVSWEEPFGLVMVEAMACGTPVIGYARGAVPEVVKDNYSGFIVNYDDETASGEYKVNVRGIEGIKQAVDYIYGLNTVDYQRLRSNARHHIEENFTVEKMVEKHLDVYKNLTK